MPVRLVYFSRNKLDTAAGALADRVSDILAVSVANNRKVDISGGLIFNGEWFAQALEGDRVAITETFARIERDPRHDGVSVVDCRTIDTRRFSFWWMAAAGWTTATADLFARYCGASAFNPQRLDGDAICDLIAAVIEHQMQNPTSSNAPHWLSAWRVPGSAPLPRPTARRLMSAA
jgi:hypothetical protein